MSWINDIWNVPQQIKYSQNGEEYWLKYIFDNIGTTNKYFVDIGAWDGAHLSNTKLFREMGWLGLLVDGKIFPGVHTSFVTKENVLDTLAILNTPNEFDLLAIDIDGNDYWVLSEILSKHKPRVIISEFNSEHDWLESKTIKYKPDFAMDNITDYYGYTFAAGQKLAAQFGYTIIFHNSNMNLYYLRNDLLNESTTIPILPHHKWNKESTKKWITI